jgi:soluble lytic murein transglycosylase-like protein
MNKTIIYILTLLVVMVFSAPLIAGGKLKLSVTESNAKENESLVSNNRYDKVFQANAGTSPYNTGNLLKSICATESKLKPGAVSKKGAKGLCQVTDITWKHVRKTHKDIPKDKNSRMNPQMSIHVASILLSQLDSYWNDIPGGVNKRKIILASYNAGQRNIRRAIKHCVSLSYECVKQQLPKITSAKHAKETIGFVARVETLHNQIKI